MTYKRCIANVRAGRQCVRESLLGDFCTFHHLHQIGGLKHTKKEWKDKCNKCNRARKLTLNGRCYICKNDR